jgi:hypothetical protein
MPPRVSRQPAAVVSLNIFNELGEFGLEVRQQLRPHTHFGRKWLFIGSLLRIKPGDYANNGVHVILSLRAATIRATCRIGADNIGVVSR